MLPDCVGQIARLVLIIENPSLVLPMIPHLSERENAVERINSICMRLFDLWCEHRSMTPLTYLLHCWPLMDSQPASIRRLRETLSELRKTYLETISAEAMQELFELADCADDILFQATVQERGSRANDRQAVRVVSV
jgi:hypothetical protein